MLYGKRATLHLNERRKSLRKQHADLRGLLREVPDTALSTDISERIASIQALCRTALMDSIQVCRTLSQRINVLNLGGYADALMASLRLNAVCQEVRKTLVELNAPGA
jgi:hypothetical protein